MTQRRYRSVLGAIPDERFHFRRRSGMDQGSVAIAQLRAGRKRSEMTLPTGYQRKHTMGSVADKIAKKILSFGGLNVVDLASCREDTKMALKAGLDDDGLALGKSRTTPLSRPVRSGAAHRHPHRRIQFRDESLAYVVVRTSTTTSPELKIKTNEKTIPKLPWLYPPVSASVCVIVRR